LARSAEKILFTKPSSKENYAAEGGLLFIVP